MSVFGGWVAWVYALSLICLLNITLPPPPPPPWRSQVAFEKPSFECVEGQTDALLGLKVTLTEPARYALTLRLAAYDGTAKQGHDYSSDQPYVQFAKGSRSGCIHTGVHGPDISILNDDTYTGVRTFRLQLEGTEEVTAATDQGGLCTVTINEDDAKPVDLIPARFSQDKVEVLEKELADKKFRIETASAVAENANITLRLHRIKDGKRLLLKEFQSQIGTGDRGATFQLSDVMSPKELSDAGIADNLLPGMDKEYEIDAEAPPPLFPASPRTLSIVAKNDDGVPNVQAGFTDLDGKPVKTIQENKHYRFTVAIDRPVESDTTWDATIGDGHQKTPLIIPAGETTCSREYSVPDNNHRDPSHCGFRCQPKGGCCKGQAGCQGDIRYEDDEAAPGDYLVILVNNERLHEPNDTIVQQVVESLQKNAIRVYQSGVIVLNRDGESILKTPLDRPSPSGAFRPFEDPAEDVAGQMQRVLATIMAKRKDAQRPDLRAVVVWPERDLSGASGLSPVNTGVNEPISFLCVDADTEYAQAIRKAILPQANVSDSVTVRSPKGSELPEHMENIFQYGRPPVLEDLVP